jgi:acetoin utilization deacetylase AcuC-like enzyme
VVRAAGAVMDGQVRNAFCAVRPPGHHAEFDRSMGFCMFNNVAVAAEYLIAERGLKRVAIVDFDVHHGNGTQHIFEDRGDVYFISIHEDPRMLYPGTGFAGERGTGRGEGTTLNLPMPPHAGDAAYREAFDRRVIPELEHFAPQFVLVSAGFDALAGDPLAHIELSYAGIEWISRQLVNVAEHHCDGRLVSVLEGGYDLKLLSECVALHLRVLMGESESEYAI